MDPLSGLILAFAIAFLAAAASPVFLAVISALATILVYVVLGAISACIITAGVIGDWRYNKRRKAQGLPYRLPWYYRWNGWQIGRLDYDKVGYGWKDGLIVDDGRWIPMIRRIRDCERT